MAVRLAINGFGRVGRIFFKQIMGLPDFQILAVNDLASTENLAYLLKHDSVYGGWDKEVVINNQLLVIDGKEIPVLHEPDPTKLPWKDLRIDIVVECTGVFESHDRAAGHLAAGAKRVVITASPRDEVTPVFTPNVGVPVPILLRRNYVPAASSAAVPALPEGKNNIGSGTLSLGAITATGSCTTNALTPLLKILDTTLGIEKSMLTTIHGYTATQSLVDGPDKKDDFRRGRAGAANIVPYATGAAQSAPRAYPGVAGKFAGLSFRVPVFSGSIIDFTFMAKRPTNIAEVNQIIKTAAAQPEWQGIMTITNEPLVSSDILGNPHGSIVDLNLTKIVAGDLVKVCSWYDNEWGYCSMLVRHVRTVAQLIKS